MTESLWRAYNWLVPSSTSISLRAGYGSLAKEDEDAQRAVILRGPNLSRWKNFLPERLDKDFINFHTPRNDAFYSQSPPPYKPLETSRQEIRLLKVFPRKTYREHVQANPHWALSDPLMAKYSEAEMMSEQQIIACEIVDRVALSKVDGNYCTISYCAGLPETSKTILVDGLHFNAFANLEHAMEQVLDYWTYTNPGKQLLLWADQICINQQDHVERTNQVKMMREIYRRSDETYICLSNPTLKDCLWWTACVPSESQPLEVRQPLSDWPQSVFGSLEAFVTSPWWRRAWVFQEFIASPRPRFISSSLSTTCSISITWSQLASNIDFVRSDLAQTFASRLSEIAFAMKSLTPKLDEARRQASALHEANLRAEKEYTKKLGIYREQVRLEWDEAWRRERAIKRIEEEEYNVKTREYETKKLEEWLRRKQEEQAQREAYVNHKNREMQKQVADVEKSRKETNRLKLSERSHMKKEIQSLKSQRPCQVDDLRPRLERLRLKKDGNTSVRLTPSETIELAELESLFLVPQDVTAFKPTECRPWPVKSSRPSQVPSSLSSFQSTKYTAPTPPSLADIDSRQTTALQNKVNSFRMEREAVQRFQKALASIDLSPVWSMMENKQALPRILDLKVVLQHSRQCEASDSRDRIYAFIGLAPKEYAIEPDYSWKNTIIHVLLHTARRIIEHEKSLELLSYVHIGRDQVGYKLPTWVPDWVSTETSGNIRSYCQSIASDKKGRVFAASKDFKVDPEFRLPEVDEFFDAQSEKDETDIQEDDDNETYLDLKAIGIHVGVLDTLKGIVPDLPHLQIFFAKDDNHYFITPKSASLDDEVWVLHGSSMPVVLRREEPHGDMKYGFLGNVVVYNQDDSLSDVMFGQMIDLVQQGKAVTQEIWLV